MKKILLLCMLFATITTFSFTVDKVHPEIPETENVKSINSLELVAVSNFDTVTKMFLFSDPYLFGSYEAKLFYDSNLTTNKETFDKTDKYILNKHRLSLFQYNSLVKETSTDTYKDVYSLQIIPKNLQTNFLLKQEKSLSRNQSTGLHSLRSDFLCFKLKK